MKKDAPMTKRTEREPETVVRRTITLSADNYAFAKTCMGDESQQSLDAFIAVAIRALRGHLSAMSVLGDPFGSEGPDEKGTRQ